VPALESLSPEELVADVAASYDAELVASSIRRLHALQAGSGRTCERCHERKSLSGFSRDARDPIGLRRYCRGCASAAYRARTADSA
jgi:hypothetical protein